MQSAVASAGLVCVITPPLERRVKALLGRLESSVPRIDTLVPSHGDFHARQLLSHGDRLAVIDFDEMCLAPAALDLTTYVAHVVRGQNGDFDRGLESLDRLFEGYGERPQALSWYLATSILRRAPFPFRYLDDHWPDRVESMVQAAEEALSL
jgi:Ser/Thr protein kinase RdoA (MazF antagonist)